MKGIRCDYRDPVTNSRCDRRNTKLVFGGVREERAPADAVIIQKLLIAFRCPKHS
jgi:hypothetical protein